MNTILGATGQVGSLLVRELLAKGAPVRAVVRKESKAQKLKELGAEVVVANFFNLEELKNAFHGSTSVFLLTPENPESNQFLKESKIILKNYKEAILSKNVKKVVGLSSMGAQHETGTGNLLASYFLEQTFSDVDIEQVFVRPAYYYSNWIGYLDLVKEQGILPTFFPLDMNLQMIAPEDVAKFLAEVMMRQEPQEKIVEISGPHAHSSREIGKIFEEVTNREVTLQQILPTDWESTMLQVGFSKDGAENLMKMTQAVIEGKTKNETDHPIILSTDFKTYLKNHL